MRKAIFFLIFFLAASHSISAQEKPKKIRLIQADALNSVVRDGLDVNIFIGEVIFEHDSAFLYCDTAYVYEETNSLDAYGNVHVLLNDTLSLYSDMLKYSGNTKIADAYFNVRLIDNQTELYTDHLIYNRNTKTGFYPDHGRIVDEENTLTSVQGYYFTNEKTYFFKDSVVVKNEDYTMFSDTLKYNTETKITEFFGPTTIKGENNTIKAKSGWYDTQNDISELFQDVHIEDKGQIVSGDSIFYERAQDFAEVFGHVCIHDTAQDIYIKGGYGIYKKADGFGYVVDSAHAIIAEERDSLFMHADTLRMLFDSLRDPSKMLAYYQTKFYRKDLQGLCDSLIYDFQDSTISLLTEPVMWSQENQMTSDTIRIYSSNQQIDSLELIQGAFVISQDSTESFNQIKGRNIVAYLKNNDINKIYVDGNAETIYYLRDEERKLVGINKAISGQLYIKIRDRAFQSITYIDQPDATLYPDKDLPQPERTLRDFIWITGKRPMNKYEIFGKKATTDPAVFAIPDSLAIDSTLYQLTDSNLQDSSIQRILPDSVLIGITDSLWMDTIQTIILPDSLNVDSVITENLPDSLIELKQD